MPNLDPTTPINLEQLVPALLPDIYDAVRWAYLRYQGRICQDEFDDLSQQIILMLIEDNCRRLRSFNYQASFKTWLQVVINHHVCKYFHRRKHTECLDEVDLGLLIYSPRQYQDIDIAEKRMLLFRALGKLSKQEQLLYKLIFVFEQDAQKISAIFKMDIRDVYKRKHLLFHKLTRLISNFQNR